tara:strand:+ start:967 stop:1215 length:249 start_codon:yes stop_codon:yes gene_type:complete
MLNDGSSNEFEQAHQKGLQRGFDLGWSYKGRFDRQLISDKIESLKNEKPTSTNKTKMRTLIDVLNTLKSHPNNRENITINSW